MIKRKQIKNILELPIPWTEKISKTIPLTKAIKNTQKGFVSKDKKRAKKSIKGSVITNDSKSAAAIPMVIKRKCFIHLHVFYNKH